MRPFRGKISFLLFFYFAVKHDPLLFKNTIVFLLPTSPEHPLLWKLVARKVEEKEKQYKCLQKKRRNMRKRSKWKTLQRSTDRSTDKRKRETTWCRMHIWLGKQSISFKGNLYYFEDIFIKNAPLVSSYSEFANFPKPFSARHKFFSLLGFLRMDNLPLSGRLIFMREIIRTVRTVQSSVGNANICVLLLWDRGE